MSTVLDLKLRSEGDCRWDLISFGEVMLRFDPGEGRITSTREFRVWEGGGEYNVARGLRRCFRLRASIVTMLVENQVGRLIEDLIMQGGVDTSNIHWVDFDGIGRTARNGIYFLERGFGVRGGAATMDRGYTAISQLAPGQMDWDSIFSQGVRWFHTGGIMAALSPTSTLVVQEAMEAARRHGTIVSFDCNYRPSLWKMRGGRAGAIAVNRQLMPFIDVFFGHAGDLSASHASMGPVWHTLPRFASAAEQIIVEFPQMKVLATTIRRTESATRNGWSAFACAGGAMYEGLNFPNLEILDRVGGGDAFASGVIYGLLAEKGMQWALDCGVAHGALAMTTPGDSSTATLAEVERLMSGGDAGTTR